MKIKLAVLAVILLCIFACNAKHNIDQTIREAFEAGAEFQHQKATSLTLLRFISIIENAENIKTKQDIDYWIDLGIIELSFQEEKKASTSLPAELRHGINKIKHEFTAKQPEMPSFTLIYRKIAEYRKDHPRIHAVLLDETQKKLIDRFIQKYEGQK